RRGPGARERGAGCGARPAPLDPGPPRKMLEDLGLRLHTLPPARASRRGAPVPQPSAAKAAKAGSERMHTHQSLGRIFGRAERMLIHQSLSHHKRVQIMV
uniref:Uncharacterized protein n=1 Tax=Accipiter nisus TaxID=211598 RepID=A0A8B9MAD9_9AVES